MLIQSEILPRVSHGLVVFKGLHRYADRKNQALDHEADEHIASVSPEQRRHDQAKVAAISARVELSWCVAAHLQAPAFLNA